ncbi:hypothetical protein [Sporosarcina pasteurii]|uniref:Lipoprotein n=1 Tax=Sporosarcina pasteurii TaxID=1474 RepID=A0A380BEQ7_SPOPA|nr:hypothetical protein [Sporosarcina pasteurii]MDS9470416.1 hypothetical protein [Sporosarcina pasteurii]QBQ05885.1 hypothetical protein E2C16_09455 [Sporosarcina pasteurii]SUJ00217.1 Uncharacterised protein [Sporosarcina pasteurii]
MLKKSYLFSTLLIAMLILAACGNTGDNNDPDVENETGTAPNEEVEKHEDTEKQDEDVSDELENDEKAAENDENVEDSVENEKPQSNDFLTIAEQVDSDAQDFSMYILPEYTLTSEEPGRDSLYLTEDGQIFMRIETLPADEETYTYLKENTITTLEATSSGSTPTELTDENFLPQGAHIENAVGYTVTTAEGIVTGIVFERNDLLVRLTIFDTQEGLYFSDFLKMGETVVKK